MFQSGPHLSLRPHVVAARRLRPYTRPGRPGLLGLASHTDKALISAQDPISAAGRFPRRLGMTRSSRRSSARGVWEPIPATMAKVARHTAVEPPPSQDGRDCPGADSTVLCSSAVRRWPELLHGVRKLFHKLTYAICLDKVTTLLSRATSITGYSDSQLKVTSKDPKSKDPTQALPGAPPTSKPSVRCGAALPTPST